jgi:Flp pilus assembly protein TadB
MQRDWVDYMTAFGTVGAAVVSLLAIAVALGIATYDRRRESAREDRERKIQAAQRRLDNALAVLDAWEQCWAIKPTLGSEPALYVADGDPPELRSAIGRAIALVSASTERYE